MIYREQRFGRICSLHLQDYSPLTRGAEASSDTARQKERKKDKFMTVSFVSEHSLEISARNNYVKDYIEHDGDRKCTHNFVTTDLSG